MLLKSFAVKRDDIILPEITVQLFGDEFRCARFVGFYAMDDEIEIVRKRLDLRLVSGLQTVFRSSDNET